ncbi:hypothetical protein [Paracoccus sp. (in: a-proteobacteria)]|uniref:hypothetical protein n=1 Tax=Paracoccus sp. TaxID=267 RepID=UPI0035B38A9B
MLEEYVKLIEQLCAPNLAAEVRSIDMTQSGSQSLAHKISQDIQRSNRTDCLSAYVGYLAYNVSSRTAPAMAYEFLTAAAMVPRDNRATLQSDVAKALTKFKPSASNHKMYFNVAGLYKLQLPESYSTEFSGADFWDHSQLTMSYYKYLIMIGDPEGSVGFDRMLTQNKDDISIVFGLVSALSDVAILMHREGRSVIDVRKVLEKYQNDDRRTAGVNGPGTGGAPQDIVRPVLMITGR